MSNIVNYKTGRTVNREDYVDDGFGDVYQRNLVEKGLLPVIYWGFDVTAGSGLNVLVGAGAARGQDLTFTINGNTSDPLPTIVNDINTATTISIPANAKGWIVLNVNVWASTTPGTSSNGDLYQISATTSATIPPGGAKGPMFVTDLQPNSNTTWPYTQIVLALVVTDATSVVNIDQTYNPPTNGTFAIRSFDMQKHFNLSNNGSFNVLSNTGFGTIAIPGYINNLGTNNQLPIPTLSWKYGTLSQSVGSNIAPISLPVPFPNKMLFVFAGGIGTASGSGQLFVHIPFAGYTDGAPDRFTINLPPIEGASNYNIFGSYFALGY